MVENSLLTSKIDSKTPKLSKNTLAVPAVEIYSFLSNATTFPQEMSNFFWSVAWLRYAEGAYLGLNDPRMALLEDGAEAENSDSPPTIRSAGIGHLFRNAHRFVLSREPEFSVSAQACARRPAAAR